MTVRLCRTDTAVNDMSLSVYSDEQHALAVLAGEKPAAAYVIGLCGCGALSSEQGPLSEPRFEGPCTGGSLPEDHNVGALIELFARALDGQ